MVDTNETPEEAEVECRRKDKRKKIAIAVIAAVVIVLVIGGAVMGIYAWRFRSATDKLLINDVDLSGVPDGTYSGSYNMFHDSTTVSVTVKDHQIVEIEVTELSPGGMEEKIETLSDTVTDGQSLEVDTVGGATASCKVFLKAVENALCPPNGG